MARVIVVSLFARDSAALFRLAASQSALADALEYRLDGLDDPKALTEADLAALFAAGSKPAVVAVNAPDAWGRFAGTDRDRLALLERAARAGAAYVDVDWRLAEMPLALPAECRRIVSRHDTRATPGDLAAAFAELARVLRPGDLPKFVTHARSGEDGVRVLEFARTLAGPAIVFASGEAGRFTRVLAPIFGSFATYAAPVQLATLADGEAGASAARDGGPTAPGQMGVDELRAALPRRGPTRDTHVYAVLGRPVAQSLSPRLHSAVFRESGRDAVYVAIEPTALETLLPLCAAPNWRGFSVTAPFKQAAARMAGDLDDVTRDVRAANTLLRRVDGGWSGTNTDTLAVEDLVRVNLERIRVSPRDARALVIGTGGAARGVLCALERLGCESIVVAGRNFHATVELALDRAVEAAELGEASERVFDVVVNCTPAGSITQPDVMPIDACVLRPGKVFVEAVYRPARTPLVAAAERVGAHVVPGTEWFLAQARGQAQRFAVGPWSEGVLRRELELAIAEESDVGAPPRTPAGNANLELELGHDSAHAREHEQEHGGESPAESPARGASRSRPAQPSTPTPASTGKGRSLLDIGDRLTRAFPLHVPRRRHVLERTIALVGLRASGKSSLAAALARELGATCVDLDDQVARLAADPELPTAGDVLAARGEAEFRRLETLALIALLTCGEPIVLATGGGVVETPANRDLLAAHATVVWLRVPVEELQRRLRADPTPRPPLLGHDTVGEVAVLARRREPLYAALAQLTLDAAAAEPAELARDLLTRLAETHRDTVR